MVTLCRRRRDVRVVVERPVEPLPRSRTVPVETDPVVHGTPIAQEEILPGKKGSIACIFTRRESQICFPKAIDTPVPQGFPIYQLLPSVDGGQMGSESKARDLTAVPIRFILHKVKALLPIPDPIFQAAGRDGRGAGWTRRAFFSWK